MSFEPLHYLALLETKPGALDQARPLRGWTLPECFALLRRRLEGEYGGEGTREYIRALRMLEEMEVDFVVLARFMKILSSNFVWRYKNKIINIHPSLLPSFPGPQAYRQAYEYGVKIIGVTSHFVSMRLDEGPIIAQAGASIPANASLKEIVAIGQKLESSVLVKAVRLYLTKRLDVYWGTVKEV